MDETLFELPPAEEGLHGQEGAGKPRLKQANREQLQMQPTHLDALLGEDHPARLVWDLVSQLDLSPLYEKIRAVEGHPGQNTIDPRILMALWLYATLEGVGSARALDRLCEEHHAYRWICGGVSVNYHTLADFRVEHGQVLDRMLTESVAALMAEGLVSLRQTAQDGLRLRAHAGHGSFQGRPSLERCREEAESHLRAMKQELESDPAVGSRRRQAAQERAGQERAARVREALKHLETLEKRQRKSHKKQSRLRAAKASTTDPEARLMRMADGGFRPGYNAQLAVDTETRLVMAVDVTNQVDQGQMAPMVSQLEKRYGHSPSQHLVDGGFVTMADLRAVSPPHGATTVYAPVPDRGPSTRHLHESHIPAILDWRARMQTPEAQGIYRQRASTVEWVQAMMRNRGLHQVCVRGRQKVKAILLWFALLHNLLIAHWLRDRACIEAHAG